MPQTPVGRRTARTLTAVSCAALLAACGGGDASPGRADGASSSSAGAARGDGSSPADGARGDAPPPAGRDRSASWPGGGDDRDVVARRRVSLRTPEDAPPSVRPTADLLIRGLTVRGRVATLRFTAVVHGWQWQVSSADREAGRRAPYAPTLYEINPGRNVDRVTASLVDPVNLRRHAPLQDSEGEELAGMTWAAGGSGSGRPIDASWMFAAPPADVDAVDVQVGSWPVFREVPVARR